MGKPPAKTPKEIVDGILDKLIDAEINPSDDELEWFAKQLGGMTPDIMKDHFRARYRNQTGTTDDPFDLPPPEMDQV
jgi:hypothetical protein